MGLKTLLKTVLTGSSVKGGTWAINRRERRYHVIVTTEFAVSY